MGRKKKAPGEGLEVQFMVRLTTRHDELLQSVVEQERKKYPERRFEKADAVREALALYIRDKLPPTGQVLLAAEKSTDYSSRPRTGSGRAGKR